MKKRIILIILLFIVVAGVVFGIIDYNRIKDRKMPIFMVRVGDAGKTKINYIGLGYKMQRVVGVSYKEPITSDSQVSFSLWFFKNKTIFSTVKVETIDLKTAYINVNEINNCDNINKLYYSSASANIYTYCLDSIKLNIESKEYDLKEYIDKHNGNIKMLAKIIILNNGVLTNNDNLTARVYKNDELTLVRCRKKKIDGRYSEKVYLGKTDKGYNENFCNNN